MRSKVLFSVIVLTVASAITASAQIGNILNKAKPQPKPKPSQEESAKPAPAATPRSGDPKHHADNEFLYMGRNDMDGESIRDMRACVLDGDKTPPPISKVFRTWSDEISEVAAIRSFNSSACQVIGFYILDHPAHKWKNIDSLTETAQGHSIYKTVGDKLSLVRKVDATQFYIVVVPDHNKPGLKLADLRMCGYPDTIKLFRRKVNSVSNCHDQKQKLYVFEAYKRYPGPMQTSSVIFDEAEFNTLNKQGKFRGLVIYKLVGEELVAGK